MGYGSGNTHRLGEGTSTLENAEVPQLKKDKHKCERHYSFRPSALSFNIFTDSSILVEISAWMYYLFRSDVVVGIRFNSNNTE